MASADRDLRSEHWLFPSPAASTDDSIRNTFVSPVNLSQMPPPQIPTRRLMSKSLYTRPQTNTQIRYESNLLDGQDFLHPATQASLMELPTSRAKKLAKSHQEPPPFDCIEALELSKSTLASPSAGSLASVRIASQTPRPERSMACESHVSVYDFTSCESNRNFASHPEPCFTTRTIPL